MGEAFKVRFNPDLLKTNQRWGLRVIRMYLAGQRHGFTPTYPPEPTTPQKAAPPTWRAR